MKHNIGFKQLNPWFQLERKQWVAKTAERKKRLRGMYVRLFPTRKTNYRDIDPRLVDLNNYCFSCSQVTPLKKTRV